PTGSTSRTTHAPNRTDLVARPRANGASSAAGRTCATSPTAGGTACRRGSAANRSARRVTPGSGAAPRPYRAGRAGAGGLILPSLAAASPTVRTAFGEQHGLDVADHREVDDRPQHLLLGGRRRCTRSRPRRRPAGRSPPPWCPPSPTLRTVRDAEPLEHSVD